VNGIADWLDASMIYGSDAAIAANLRLPDGRNCDEPQGPSAHRQ
jgi:hypothetical protein